MNAADAKPKESPEQIERRKKAELLAKVQQMRSNAGNNVTAVRPRDPGGSIPQDKKYVWANQNEMRAMSFKAMGYEVCKDPRITTNFERADGTHIYADHILMCIDIDLYDAIKTYNCYKAIEYAEGAQDTFSAFAQRSGIPVLDLRETTK